MLYTRNNIPYRWDRCGLSLIGKNAKRMQVPEIFEWPEFTFLVSEFLSCSFSLVTEAYVAQLIVEGCWQPVEIFPHIPVARKLALSNAELELFMNQYLSARCPRFRMVAQARTERITTNLVSGPAPIVCR